MTPKKHATRAQAKAIDQPSALLPTKSIHRALAVGELLVHLLREHSELATLDAIADGPLYAKLQLQAHGRRFYITIEEGLPR